MGTDSSALGCEDPLFGWVVRTPALLTGVSRFLRLEPQNQMVVFCDYLLLSIHAVFDVEAADVVTWLFPLLFSVHIPQFSQQVHILTIDSVLFFQSLESSFRIGHDVAYGCVRSTHLGGQPPRLTPTFIGKHLLYIVDIKSYSWSLIVGSVCYEGRNSESRSVVFAATYGSAKIQGFSLTA